MNYWGIFFKRISFRWFQILLSLLFSIWHHHFYKNAQAIRKISSLKLKKSKKTNKKYSPIKWKSISATINYRWKVISTSFEIFYRKVCNAVNCIFTTVTIVPNLCIFHQEKPWTSTRRKQLWRRRNQINLPATKILLIFIPKYSPQTLIILRVNISLNLVFGKVNTRLQ